MKKITAFLLTLLLALSLVGCSAVGSDSDKLSVVCTTFPQYDWVRSIANGVELELTLLMDDGIDLHNYQPTAADMAKISSCDLFIFVGGESDDWTEGALANATSEKLLYIDMMSVEGVKTSVEEHIEGMEDEGDEDGHEEELDEHIWLSLSNCAVLCRSIANALITLDPDNEQLYESNLSAYLAEVDELYAEYAELAEEVSGKTVLFADRFPFRYLTDDLGLSYYAAFKGCSAESEASFATVMFLAKKVDELGLKYVFTTETSDLKLANTVINSTSSKDAEILTLDALQSVTTERIEAGETYLGVMRSNLETLKYAFLKMDA
ncbi:MAG TPA: metal ABC transporter substrate-binding protein [Eubacteriales bacterium]|nr:metal ABC transporter substrate-binding protein [Eubacteriales bacterium]